MSFVQIERDQLESISIALCEAYEALEKHAEYQSALGEAHFEPVNTEAFVREKVGDTCDSLEYFLKKEAQQAEPVNALEEAAQKCERIGDTDDHCTTMTMVNAIQKLKGPQPAGPDELPAWRQPLFTTGHCKEKAKAGGCQLHNLQCGYPACDRKLT
jgi:hypothetical protein